MVTDEAPAVPVAVSELSVAVPLGSVQLGSPKRKVCTGPCNDNKKATQGSPKSLRTGGMVTEAFHA